jgi:uncharacterized membrane protein YsdA (DUF1294 family)
LKIILCAAVFALWNIISYTVTCCDKRAAVRKRRRVREWGFCLFALVFGGAGVLIGFYTKRHKTRHRLLLFAVWSLTLVSYAALAYFSIYCSTD